MAFLVPEPVGRPPVVKGLKSCAKRPDMRSLFGKIRDLCRTPSPKITRLDESVFVSNLFSDIHELCRRPELLAPIEETIDETPETPAVETKVYQKPVKQYYSDSCRDTNSFDLIHNSKHFLAIIKRKPSNCVDSNVKTESSETSDKMCTNDNQIHCKSQTKRSTVKCVKSDQKSRKPLRPILSIDCDITSKINQYSKMYSKQRLKRGSNGGNKCDTNSKTHSHQSVVGSKTSESIETTTDCSYESIPSPSVSTSCPTSSYSMPATPISSENSWISHSSQSSVSTQSLLTKIRNSLNPKYESYRQYAEKCVPKKTTKKCRTKGLTKSEIDFNEKVLEWKTNRLCSGNTTPVHNMEYLVTPPGSPQRIQNNDNVLIHDELNEMFDCIQNEAFNQSDNFNNEFNSLLLELSEMNE